MASHYPGSKRIGGYLMDAGLLSPAQVDVVLSDQELTGMRFGEILVSRGWLKSQTIEFLFQNVILPHRTLAKQAVEKARQEAVDHLKEANTTHQSSPTPLNMQKPAIPSSEQVEIAPKKQRSAPSLPKPFPSPAASGSQPSPERSTSPRLLSIHDRETLATHDKLNLEDLPDWLEMDMPD